MNISETNIYDLFSRLHGWEFNICLCDKTQSLQFSWSTRFAYRKSNNDILDFLVKNLNLTPIQVKFLYKFSSFISYWIGFDPKNERFTLYFDFPHWKNISFLQKQKIAMLVWDIFLKPILILPPLTVDILVLWVDFQKWDIYDYKVYGKWSYFSLPKNLYQNDLPIVFYSNRWRIKRYIKIGLWVQEYFDASIFDKQPPFFQNFFPKECSEFMIMFVSSEVSNSLNEIFYPSQMYIQCPKKYFLDTLSEERKNN